MNTFAVLLLCVHACLVQTVFGQCAGDLRGNGGLGYSTELAGVGIADGALGYRGWNGALGYGAGALGYGAGALGYGAGTLGYGAGALGDFAPAIAPAVATYGGEGVGNVAVGGEMAVGGNTLVAGQVPVIGAVGFGGDVLAAGAVSITGRCDCGCGASPYY